jgi:hypothetical protein
MTIQEELREAAPHAATAEDMDLLLRAADRLEQAQTLAEERLESIGHWKAANEEIQRERDDALRMVLEVDDRMAKMRQCVRDREAEALAALADVDELRAALDFARESYGGAANDAFSAIAELCGCKQWDYPGQLVRDVERLKANWREAVKRGNSAEEYLGHEKCARIEAELALATALQQCARVTEQLVESQRNGAAVNIKLAAVERIMGRVRGEDGILLEIRRALAASDPAPFGHLSRANPDVDTDDLVSLRENNPFAVDAAHWPDPDRGVITLSSKGFTVRKCPECGSLIGEVRR